MAVKTEFLKSIPYFSGLSDSEIDSVGKYIFEKKADRGEILSFEGEPAEVLHFVTAGVVKIFKTSADGKEQIFRIIRPGDSFNDVSVLSGMPNLISAAAMGAVVLSAIKKKDLEIVLRETPQIALNIIQVLSRRVQELVSLVEDFTQQEMASMIGTAREMVGRSLKNLETEGAIRLERNRVVITDQKVLRELAGIT